ncbi:MAG: diaminopimelate epimerase, partial [Acidimicrobiales bacterium]
DFFVFETRKDEPPRPWTELSRGWCPRTPGPGADGLLLLTRIAPGHLRMCLHNQDGSLAEMSGNGMRCLVMAAHLRAGAAVGASYEVDTDAGRRSVTVVSADGPCLEISVDMGEVTDLPEPHGWAALACNPDRPVRHVSLGNPHSVVGVEDVNALDLLSLGSLVPHVNLEVVEPGPGNHEVTMRVHERGAGITRACGTGACAAADAAYAWGLVPRSAPEVTVHMEGGDARVRITADRRATLTGATVHLGDHTVHA